MSERPVHIIINDILEAVNAVLSYTDNIDITQFRDDRMRRDAVARNIEIIGEAINQLPDSFLEKHLSVEWYKPVGMRNRLIHGYFDIDYEIVWQTAKMILPEFKIQIEQIINSL